MQYCVPLVIVNHCDVDGGMGCGGGGEGIGGGGGNGSGAEGGAVVAAHAHDDGAHRSEHMHAWAERLQ